MINVRLASSPKASAISIKAKPPKAYHTSKEQGYQTPQEVIRLVTQVFGFKILADVCATKETAVVPDYLGPDHHDLNLRDALVLPWHKAFSKEEGDAVALWMNPPYNEIDKWVAKAIEEADLGAWMFLLLPSRTDRPWFYALLSRGCTMYFFKHRLKFQNTANQAPFPSILVLLAPSEDYTAFGYVDANKQEVKLYV